MKRDNLAIIYFSVTTILLIISLGACSSADENCDVYQATQVKMLGETMEPSEISADGISLSLSDNGSCVLTMDGEDYHADWQHKNGQFILSQGSDSFNGSWEGDIITLIDTLGMGLDIIFLKEGAIAPDLDAKTDNAALARQEPASDSVFIASGFASEQTIIAEHLTQPSNWYGLLTISDYLGEHNITGEYEAWGYIDSDKDGSYFELYLDAPFDDNDAIAFMSFSIALDDNSFWPIDDGLAWLYGDAVLKDNDSREFITILANGILSGEYKYDFNNQSFTIKYRLSQIKN